MKRKERDMFKKCRAFSPGGITSFFEICDLTPDGERISDATFVGARGGGFVISKGVWTEISIDVAKKEQIQVFINGRLRHDAKTTTTVVNTLLQEVSETYYVTVQHRVEVPIGAGFGSSGAGALGTALALSKALNLHLTYNQLGLIAHKAEVKCKTGLGTVGPLMLGGCIITIEPGAPGYSQIDRIPFSSHLRIVTGTFSPISTKDVLTSHEKRRTINKWGRRTLNRILDDPSLENFMHECKEFAIKTSFTTKQVQKLIKLAEENGAIGATQNMIGEAVHALVTVDKVARVVKAFKQVISDDNIIIAKVDLQGARILTN